MQIIAVGLHRNNVPENIWKRAPLGQEALQDYTGKLAQLDSRSETFFVNSQHSIEIFAVSEDETTVKNEIEGIFLRGLELEKPHHSLFHHLKGPDAVRHFLQLSLGMETFTPKEKNDFLNNARQSIAIAKEYGISGHILNRLYQTALMLAAKVEQAGLTFDYSYISSQILSLVNKIFGSLSSVGLFVIGVNDLTSNLLESLHTDSFRETAFIHRTPYLVEELAQSYSGTNISSSEFDTKLVETQVVLRMNQDFSNWFQESELQKIMSKRKNEPLLVINLDATIATEASVEKIYNLFLYDLADFQQHQSDKNGIGVANEMIESELKRFFSWFYSKEHYRFGDIIGKGKAIEEICELVARISQTNITVLIQGDSGTGKELVARAIHENSPKRNKPFIVLNCGALPETLLESELFGHVRGAFTGATGNKKGLLEEADGGTLMLDEIGDTSQAFQVKLLRVLQEGEMRRVGSNEVHKIDVRIIAATNKRLDERIKDGSFRSDLYYRLNVVQIDIPPLTDRLEDVPLLADYFIAKYSEIIKKRVIGLSDEARDLIMSYPWPGNVRELENAIRKSCCIIYRTNNYSARFTISCSKI